MKAKFIGDPDDDFSGPKVLRMGYGPAGKPLTLVYFPRDQFVGVPKELEAKIASHNHFETEEGDAAPYIVADEQTRADRAMDGDGNGKTGGSLTKAVTLEKLAALKEKHPELEYDPKWGLPKLRGALEEAEFEYGDED